MENDVDSQRTMMNVWDWQLRVLHWFNALIVILLILLILGNDGLEFLGVARSHRLVVEKLHAYAGHLFILTFTLRVVWGFIGNSYSRWSDIIPYKKESWARIWAGVKWYLGGFETKRERVAGHDPLASLFYVVLFIVLGVQIATGVVLSGFEFNTFPGILISGGVAEASAKGVKHAFKEVHEFGMTYVIFFFAAHLAGLVVHEIKEKNGLFSSMIHGRKYFTKE